MSKNNMSLTKKFTILGSVLVIVCVVVTASTCLYLIRNDLVKQANNTLDGRLKVFWELVMLKDTTFMPTDALEYKIKNANFRVEDGRLFIGFYSLTDDTAIVDQIKNIFGGAATVFLGDERISTSIVDKDGKRATGTKLQGPAHEAVIKKGMPYRGRATILGTDYFTAYDPIKDNSGNVIGILFIGTPASEYFAAVNRIMIVISIVALFLIVVINLFVFGFTKKITRPLIQLIPIANRLADGDLAVEIDTGKTDEVGQVLDAMENMVKKWKGVVNNVKETSGRVAGSGHQLNASADQMLQLSRGQSQRSSQVATAAEEMSQTVLDIARNVNSIAESSTETAGLAKEGEGIVDRAVAEVKEIAETVDVSAQFVRLLGDRSKHIGEIVNVIGDIADQTNLLALNAAIEAARAGDQGRGFAVVADEVRKLAERTAQATSEISNMIKTIQDDVFHAVDSMENASGKVNVGVELSAQAGEALKVIVKKVDDLQLMVQQIASATEEMSTTSDEISKDIEQIALGSQETSGSSEHTAQAATELSRLSDDLQEAISGFRL